MADRVGIAWRNELRAELFERRGELDLLQVIADDWLRAGPASLAALHHLARQIPLHLHGTGLGLASASPVDEQRVDSLARLIGAIEPDSWSEHLAFVRAGGIELGHLAAPPRTRSTIDGAVSNLRRIRGIVGSTPAVENVATMIVPPGSDCDEAVWTRSIVEEANAPLLLDLHNLHSNAKNGGIDSLVFLDTIPLNRVAVIHVAGGRIVRAPSGAERLLDDHAHDVPAEVWVLLEEVAARVPGPLDVILEREDRYPAIESLFAELDVARAALALGRSRRKDRVAA